MPPDVGCAAPIMKRGCAPALVASSLITSSRNADPTERGEGRGEEGGGGGRGAREGWPTSARLVQSLPCLGESLVRHAAHDRARIIDSSPSSSSSRRRSVDPSCPRTVARDQPGATYSCPVAATRPSPPHCRRRGLHLVFSAHGRLVRVYPRMYLSPSRPPWRAPSSHSPSSSQPLFQPTKRGRHAAAPRSPAHPHPL